MKLRSLIIALVVVAVLIGLFMAYNYISPTPDIKERTSELTAEAANGLDVNEPIGHIGDTGIGGVEDVSYVTLDENKKVERVFGFSKLLHQTGNNWDLSDPFMKIIEDNFVCRISAKTGNVQVEMLAGKPTPRDARLEGDVVIHIQPAQDSKIRESHIYMDDVTFNSERSQFSTDGPVRFVSEQAEMVGTGLQVIYNSILDRLEYFRVIDLDFLHIKDLDRNKTAAQTKSSDKPQLASAQKQPTPDQNQAIEDKNPPANNTDAKQPTANTDSAESGNFETEKQKDKYRCIFSKNVVIRYGKQLIYADEVTLSNVLFSSSDDQKNPKQNTTEPKTINNTAKPQPAPNSPGTNKTASTQETEKQTDDIVDLMVTCDNGITARPMDFFEAINASKQLSPERMIEFKGFPVRVREHNKNKTGKSVFTDNAPQDGTAYTPFFVTPLNPLMTIAECGMLKYNMDEEILDMSGYLRQKHVSINLDQSNATLKTIGPIRWTRLSNTAVINGPGTIYMYEQSPAADAMRQKARMDFAGVMKLYFASNHQGEQMVDSPPLKRIDLLGPMSAKLSDNAGSHLAANQARLDFNDNSKLVQADLDGKVRFGNDNGDVSATKAMVYFAKNDTPQKDSPEAVHTPIERIDLSGPVIADMKDDRNSRLRSDSAKLHFGRENQLMQADMNGHVEVQSDSGMINVDDAQIEFGTDANNNTAPKTVKGQGNVRLQPKTSADSSQPAVFRAATIDYDLDKGRALAGGPPIEFTFFTTPDRDDPNTTPVPVVITATGSAEYLEKQNRVIFQKNVVGKMIEPTPTHHQHSSFFGDKLIVDLASQQQQKEMSTGSIADSDVKHITIEGDVVKLVSIRKQGAKVMAGIELTCEQIDYNAAAKLIEAKGPGEIKIDNSKAEQPQSSSRSIDLKRPCYARIDRFSKLKWYTDKGRVIAESNDGPLYMGYLPILPDQSYGDKVEVNAGNIDARFRQTLTGQTEVQSVIATDGVVYEDTTPYKLVGDDLFYDGTTSWVKITAGAGRTCILNGVRVKDIEYNLATEEIKAELAKTPGTIGVN